MMKVDYEKIYTTIRNYKRKVITASQLAYTIGVERIYGGTMAKLVRDGVLEKAPADGYYYIVK